MKKISEIIVNKCLKPSKKDNILIVTDTVKEKIARPIFNFLQSNNYRANLVIMSPTSADGEEPNNNVRKKIIESSAIVALTKWSLTHTKPMQIAKKHGAKIISMPAVTKRILDDCLDVNYEKLKQSVQKVAMILTKTKNVYITTQKGTNLKLNIDQYLGRDLYGIAKAGESINLPEGEANCGIDQAKGVLVINGSMSPDQNSPWGKIGKIKSPIYCQVENNYVTKISGKREAKILTAMLESFHDRSVYYLAELGIGLNPKARIVGNITEDEKVLGTIHVALGNNLSFGGKNYAPVHLDGIIKKPTLVLDDYKLIDNGKLKLK